MYSFISSLLFSGNGRLPADEIRNGIRSVHIPIPDYLLTALLNR